MVVATLPRCCNCVSASSDGSSGRPSGEDGVAPGCVICSPCASVVSPSGRQPLYREGQRIAFKLGAFGIYRLQCRIQLTDLCLIDRGIGDTGPVNGDRAVAGDNPINGRQRRGLVSIERRVPVMRVLVIVVNDRRLAPFVNRVTAVVYAAAAVLRQVAVGGNDAGVMSNLP